MQALIAFPLPIKEDMALRKEHENLIRVEVERQISQAVDSFRPHGWKKAVSIIRELGPITAIIGVFVALIAIVITLWIFAANGMTKNAEFRTHTEDRLTSIEGQLTKINGALSGISLKQIANKPITPQTIAEAKHVLIEAASNNVKINQSVVEEVGTKFVEAAQNDPAAWNAALGFLNYKSFLDASSSEFPINATPTKPLVTHYKMKPPPGEKMPTVSFPSGVAVPIEQAARFGLIGEDENKGLPRGNPLLLVEGGGIVIDGMDMKNVIFRGVHIVYHGGPLKMSNVYFANCVFDVTRERPGESFAATFLKSGPATSFAAG